MFTRGGNKNVCKQGSDSHVEKWPGIVLPTSSLIQHRVVFCYTANSGIDLVPSKCRAHHCTTVNAVHHVVSLTVS